MHREQFEIIDSYQRHHLDRTFIFIGELIKPDVDRTLIYGYTKDNKTFHIYLKDSVMHRLVYDTKPTNFRNEYIMLDYSKGTYIAGEYLIPDAYVYPAASDFDFCMLLISKNIQISFSAFDKRPATSNQTYQGKTEEDIREQAFEVA